jgi:photosystem II stability/assembly factor-like uncharacterized protein
MGTQTSNTTENLRGLSVPTPAVAWASGTHGTYLRTTDAGVTWSAAQMPGAESLDFRDVEAFSVRVAYLLAAGPGELSRIYKTSDSGQHWTLQFTNHDPQGFLDCMAFWDANHGIVLGDPVGGKFTLLTTSDGGHRWTPLQHPPAAIDGEGAFAASGTCIAVAKKNDVWFVTGGASARVFHSADRGKIWSVAETPLPHSNATSGVFSIAFTDRIHGAIAGGDYKAPESGSSTLAFTHDGGKTWQPALPSPQKYCSAVALFARRKSRVGALAVGTAGAAFVDDIKTNTWTTTWPLNLNSAAFDPNGNAFAVGPKGAIIRFHLAAEKQGSKACTLPDVSHACRKSLTKR